MILNTIVNVEILIKNKKIIQNKYLSVFIYWVYSSNQITLFFIKKLLFLQYNLKFAISIINITYIILIISLQKHEKKPTYVSKKMKFDSKNNHKDSKLTYVCLLNI